MIQNITASHLRQISVIMPNLETEIRNNLGIISSDKDKVLAFALYNRKNEYNNVFRLYGSDKGIQEIINYFLKKNKEHLFIQVPFKEINVLNVLKNMNIFSFNTSGNVIIASYPAEERYAQSFKDFMNQE